MNRFPFKFNVFVGTLLLMLETAALAQETPAIVTLDPPSIARANSYSHGKLVPMSANLLFTAGQVGRNKDGELGDGIEEQAMYAMNNLLEVIKAAGMDGENILKMTVYYLQEDHIGPIFAARNRVFGDTFRPASTAVVVKSLASPGLMVEVEAIAASL
ncbi:MAG: RidA family protein [Pseudohongiellaceae bacterium]